ncbi:MAG: hypothetical protein AAGL49_02915, partial [Pseudomonadota bacterium]
DLSLSGLAALADYSCEFEPDVESIWPLTFVQGEETVFSARGQVRRVEETAFGLKIAFKLYDRHFDLGELGARNRAALLRERLAANSPDISKLVPSEYKQLCSEVLHLLRQYESILGDAEGDDKVAEHFGGDFLEACETAIRPAWRSLWRDANRLVRPLEDDKPIEAAARRFTELVLTPEFARGPIWGRSYEKPLGYPGDFEIMKYVYDWRREGTTRYEKLLHMIGLDVAECIGTRMLVVKETIEEIVASRAGREPVRIASLGCGPAREVELYLKDRQAPSAPVAFTLIDQESRALSTAYERSYPYAVTTNDVSIDCLNISFMELIRASGRQESRLEPQDFIYTVGLIDYLSLKLARSLVSALYEKLKPGGLLVIGNMNDTPVGNLWPMEYICDWRLHYRTDAQMRELASHLPTDEMWTKTDPTGRVYMLYVWKPKA